MIFPPVIFLVFPNIIIFSSLVVGFCVHFICSEQKLKSFFFIINLKISGNNPCINIRTIPRYQWTVFDICHMLKTKILIFVSGNFLLWIDEKKKLFGTDRCFWFRNRNIFIYQPEVLNYFLLFLFNKLQSFFFHSFVNRFKCVSDNKHMCGQAMFNLSVYYFNFVILIGIMSCNIRFIYDGVYDRWPYWFSISKIM